MLSARRPAVSMLPRLTKATQQPLSRLPNRAAAQLFAVNCHRRKNSLQQGSRKSIFGPNMWVAVGERRFASGVCADSARRAQRGSGQPAPECCFIWPRRSSAKLDRLEIWFARGGNMVDSIPAPLTQKRPKYSRQFMLNAEFHDHRR